MKYKELTHTLYDCINHCNYCADSCLEEEDVAKMRDCIRTDRVCAEVCSSLSQILATSYPDILGLVEYCEKICRACARECAKHEHGHCLECAEACRKCAEACKGYRGEPTFF